LASLSESLTVGRIEGMAMIKCLLPAAAMVLLAAPGASAQGHSFDVTPRVRGGFVALTGFQAIIERVQALDRMNYRVGFALAPGEFYALSQECLRSATPDDFRRLLMDPAPLVRVMGLICLARSAGPQELADAAASLDRDKAVVTYVNGCNLNQTTTVAALARQLVERRFFIGGLD
jgi:hypothetical protein